MKALVVEKWQPFKYLKVKECQIPIPGKNEYLIKVRAAGLSFATSLVVEGKYQVKPPLPFIPGTEIAGEIVSSGEEQKEFLVGQKVCAVIDHGGLGEFALANINNIFPIPKNLSYEKAISFTNTYATSLAAISWKHLLNLKRGDSLLIHGATGGIGSAAIEIAKEKGIKVIAAVGNPEKIGYAKKLGAEHVLVNQPPSFKRKIMVLTKGEGLDGVLDPIGGEVFSESLRCLRPEGRITPIGFACGNIPSIPANLILVKNISVCGLNMGLYFGWGPKDRRKEYRPKMEELMTQLFEMYQKGIINPLVTNTFSLEKANEAMELILKKKTIGRIAIKFD